MENNNVLKLALFLFLFISSRARTQLVVETSILQLPSRTVINILELPINIIPIHHMAPNQVRGRH